MLMKKSCGQWAKQPELMGPSSFFLFFFLREILRNWKKILGKIDAILKTSRRICGLIFLSFWRNSEKIMKKLLGIFKKYLKNYY